MSERRCPNCGGLVGADAEWCTQCFARLDDGKAMPEVEETVPPPAGEGPQTATGPQTPRRSSSGTATIQPGGGGLVRASGESIVWDCPACGTENPIDSAVCSACGTRFGEMFEEPEEKLAIDPGRAAMFSLIFPGAGHFIAGRRGEAFARAVIFAFALVMGVASIGPVRAGTGGPYLFLMIISLMAAAAIYVISTADAGRVAREEKQILSMRYLLYGAVGLIFVSIALLTFAATQARG